SARRRSAEMTMPSQFGQDRLVLDLLGGKRDGFFLDSGASDGVRASNTHLLERSFGWKGICIEPNATFFSALTRNRKCLCVNCCLYDREGDVDFLEDARMLGGVLDDYHPSLLNHAKRTFVLHEDAQGRLRTVPKKARTVRSILAEYR